MRSARVRAAIVAVACAAWVLVAAGPAHAHTDLAGSDPADGATLDAAPEALSFTFTEDVLPQGNAITLTELASGERFDVGAARVDGATVSVAWPDQTPAGQFRVAYRVVSADGHPIEGRISITVTVAVAAASPADPGVQPGSAAPSPSAVPVTTGDSDASGTPTGAPVTDSGRGNLVAWIVGLALAILGGAVAGTWVMRRTR